MFRLKSICKYLMIITSFFILISNAYSLDTESDETVPASSKDLIGSLLLQAVNLLDNGIDPTKGMNDAEFIDDVFQDSANIKLPQSSEEISKIGKTIDLNKLEPGDLLFFNTNQGLNSYGAIYLGNNNFIRSSYPDGRIVITSLDKNWRSGLNSAKRIIQINEDDNGKITVVNYQNVIETAQTNNHSSKPIDQLINQVDRSCNALFYNQDYNLAFSYCLKNANANDSDAQAYVGVMYRNGLGVTKNNRDAFKWLNLAINQGNSYANQQLIDMKRNNEINILDQISFTKICFGLLVVLFVCISFWKLIKHYSDFNVTLIKGDNYKINKLCCKLAIIISILYLISIILFIVNNANSVLAAYFIDFIIFIAYFLLYLELDKTFKTNLTCLYMLSIILGIITSLVLVISSYYIFTSDSILLNEEIVVSTFIYFLCFILPTIILFRTSTCFNIVAKISKNHILGYSARCMKFAAYTMPLIVGVLILMIAQIIFLMACIINNE